MPTVSGTTGSPTETTAAGDEIYTFNSSGTITFSAGGTITYLCVGGGFRFTFADADFAINSLKLVSL